MNEKKNNFVNVLCWFLIVISGLALLSSIIQNIAVELWINKEHFEILKESSNNKLSSLVFGNFPIVLKFYSLITLFIFISSIYLLKRRNWARKVFIIIFGILIVYLIGVHFIIWLNDNGNNTGKLITSILSTVFMFLFVFLLLKLKSNSVKSEYT